ncbi:MAG TPA: FAD-dependent thymidylate synthase, partial [Candidatus Cloacimonadota bacterium]|nr:FAD-dependent thymidylate synthase [Candidatus Cloacimonadota bacterium]
LSTLTQMGITINARSVEALLRRLANIPLAEPKELKELLYKETSMIAPSLIRHTEADGYRGTIDLDGVGFSNFLQQELPWLAEMDCENKVKTLSVPKNADDAILSALVYVRSELGWQDNFDTVSRLPKIAKEQLWQQVFSGIRSWHKLPRAFETAEYEFELSLSESCWAQLKRHRLCTMLKKGSSSSIHVIPDSIKQIKREQIWHLLAQESQILSDALPSSLKPTSGYLRLNSALCRVYIKINLREIYHFVRLRSDEHAQWEIREIADAITRVVQRSAPNATRYLCGKSGFKPGV